MNGYGLVLGGGGAKGSYEIGVWKALKELNIPIAAISGTSVGALNGAIMVQDEFDTAYQLWTSICIQDIIKMDNPSAFDSKKFSPREITIIIKNIMDNGGLDVTPLKELVKKYINEEKIRKSPIDFGLVTFSISELKPHIAYKNDIPAGKLTEFLIASSCFPLFKPYEINNKKYIDGGIYDNLPVSVISSKGIKDIIVVDVSGIGRVRKVANKDLNLVYIKNSEFLGKTFFFEKEACIRNMRIGYLDTMKAFKKLMGKRYYIYNYKSSKLLYPLTNCEINLLEGVFNLKRDVLSAGKLTNYNIFRTVYNYIDGKLDPSTAVYALIEITAEVLGIDRLKPYNWDELADSILQRYEEIKNSSSFNSSIVNIKSSIFSKNNARIDTIDNKHLVAYLTSLDNKDINLNNFGKLIAVFSPKTCIACIFLSILLRRAA